MTGKTSFAHYAPLRCCLPEAPTNPEAIYAALERANVPAFYPGFRAWFFGKVVPGIGEQRRIFVVSDHGSVAGLAICKRTDNERKLSTLWVHHSLRGRGIAGELAREAFEWLDSQHPVFTVPQEHLAMFSGLIRSWGFAKPVAYQSLYRTACTEYVFNGSVHTSSH